MADASLLLQLATSLGGAGVIAGVVNGVMNRRKLGAEATQVITDAATNVVTRLEAENLRMHAEFATMRAEHNLCRERDERNARLIRDLRDVLQDHATWDFKVVAALEEALGHQTHLRPPPPLLPEGLRTQA